METVSQEWVAERLDSVGIRDAITSVTEISQETVTSSLSRLEITFADQPPLNAVLKVMKANFFNDGKNEIEFYRKVYEHDLALPVPKYFGATIDEDSQTTALLIETLSEQDYPGYDWASRFQPDPQVFTRLVESLADLHATSLKATDHLTDQESLTSFWGRPAYGREIAEAASDSVDFPYLLNRFIDRTTGMISPRATTMLVSYRTVFVERMLDYLDTRPMTCLIHGDVHRGNILVPLDSALPVKMVDWANWSIDQPTEDLAHAVISQLRPEASKRHAEALMSRYLQQLKKNGISYPLEVFETDFRFALARQLVRPVILAELVPDIDSLVWQEMLQNILAGVDQFDVWPLLEP